MTLFAAGAGGPLDASTLGISLWVLVTFSLLFFLLYKTAWPKLLSALDEREDAIRKALEDADKNRAEAAALLDEHKQVMEKAKDDDPVFTMRPIGVVRNVEGKPVELQGSEGRRQATGHGVAFTATVLPVAGRLVWEGAAGSSPRSAMIRARRSRTKRSRGRRGSADWRSASNGSVMTSPLRRRGGTRLWL